MKKTNFSSNSKNKGQNPKPLHKLAKFSQPRKPIDASLKLDIQLLDLFPPRVSLSANELKVLLVLHAMANGRHNLSAIDQEQISAITSIERPHVARAIDGLRKKGVILNTFMEQGRNYYRNVYVLWKAPISSQNSEKQLPYKQKKSAREQKNKHQQKTSLPKQSCSKCDCKALSPSYIPSKDLDIYRWCFCSVGREEAKLNGAKPGDIVADHLIEKYLGKKIE